MAKKKPATLSTTKVEKKALKTVSKHCATKGVTLYRFISSAMIEKMDRDLTPSNYSGASDGDL